MNQKDIQELIALATGQAIQGYTPEEQKTKKRFLALSLKMVRDLGQRLGANHKKASINPAGPMLSGEALLFSRPCPSSEDWEISTTQNHPRNPWGDIYVRRGGVDAPIVWIKWEEILDLDGLVGRLRTHPQLQAPKREQPKGETDAH